ncbi:MAG: hypothetical protein AAFR31_11715 [Cyanobacteria bacterium J06627_8]
MSIDDDLKELPSLTEGDRALKLFTDRYEFTRLFAERLNDDPPPKNILFFWGDGGNGKSLLLKYLRQNGCKRLLPAIWQQLREQPDSIVANRLEGLPRGEYSDVPAVLVDFAPKPGADNSPQLPFYGLLKLRQELAAVTTGAPYRLHFPLHTYGCFLYLHKTGRGAEAKSLFPFEEADLVNQLVSLVTEVPGVGLAMSVLSLVNKYSGERLDQYRHRFGLSEEMVQRLQGMDAEQELIDELPRLFAQDLNVSMKQSNAPKRIVLMFDTHEAFWGYERSLSNQEYFYRDEWLRRFLRRVDLKSGIVVIVGGRQSPRWAEAKTVKPNTDIPDDYLCLKQIGHFGEQDAIGYLNKVDIDDKELQQAVIRYASVQRGEVHPFYLGLGADVVRQARNQGNSLEAADFESLPESANKSKVLIERLLQYVQRDIRDAIHALSACRAFDYEIYGKLGNHLNFGASRAQFEVLKEFSFVWTTPQRGEQWYRIHDLVRRLDYEGREERAIDAHQLLMQHYQEQGNVPEEIYHLNRLDWKEGIQRWVENFNDALKLSQYELCNRLLEIRGDLVLRDDFHRGWISQSEGSYFQQLARYGEAEQEFREAITAYDAALQRAPDYIYALNNKGLALKSLADLQASLSHHEAAMQSYGAAITAYDAALQRAPDDIQILNNKGLALQSLADLQASLSQDQDFQRDIEVILRSALEAFSRSLELAPNDDFIHKQRNELQERLSNLG